MNYNAILKYIIENLSDYREEIESTLSYIYKYRMSFQQADRGGKLEDTIMSAISDYEVDNDYEHDEILDQLLSEYDLEDIFFDAIDKMDKSVNESMNTVQWKHFDNDDRRYEAYVLIDESDGSIIYNYQVWPGDFWLDILNDAIEDAREAVGERSLYVDYSARKASRISSMCMPRLPFTRSTSPGLTIRFSATTQASRSSKPRT